MSDLLDRADREFHKGLGFARAGDFASAAVAFQNAVDAWPDYGPSHTNLGAALASLGKHRYAIQAFDNAIAVDPTSPSPHFQKGVSLVADQESAAAIACLLKAIELDPELGDAYFYLGLVHSKGGRLPESVVCLERAVELEPEFSDGWNALGAALLQLNEPREAKDAFEQALKLFPENADARARLLYLLAMDCDWVPIEAQRPLFADVGIVGGPAQPFNMLALEDRPERHLARSVNFAAASFASIEPLAVPARPKARPDKLRIGYFSADLRSHATMFLAARMFELHDRSRFTSFAYSYGREEPGPMQDRALSAFDQFQNVGMLSNTQIAELARQDGIDIAIDLKGYTEFQRVSILAHRPAPIQLSFLGYPGSLGAPFIDYLLVDQTVVPVEQRSNYSEQLIFLPHSYQPNDDTRPRELTGSSRKQVGLPPDGFVFCCFNGSYKIGAREFGIWMSLLERVEHSWLWLLDSNPIARTNLQASAAARGINPDRLIFAAQLKPLDHLARVGFADLVVDTFNYNAHTTASDALWMGVPVVSKVGAGFAARVGASLLSAIGLTELIATSDEAYENLAFDLATNPQRLAAIRTKLNANRDKMPLFNSALFTRHVETAYDLAYERYLAGLPPADIVVPA